MTVPFVFKSIHEYLPGLEDLEGVLSLYCLLFPYVSMWFSSSAQRFLLFPFIALVCSYVIRLSFSICFVRQGSDRGRDDVSFILLCVLCVYVVFFFRATFFAFSIPRSSMFLCVSLFGRCAAGHNNPFLDRCSVVSSRRSLYFHTTASDISFPQQS